MCCKLVIRALEFIVLRSIIYGSRFFLGQKLGWVLEQPASNWLTRYDLINLLELEGFEVLSSSSEQLFPFELPFISRFCNQFLVRLPFFRHLGVSLFIVARPLLPPLLLGDLRTSVVLPVCNESGHIKLALGRIPELGGRTELMIVEGNSSDDTCEVIER